MNMKKLATLVLGVSSYYQMIVKAVVILLAVLVDNKKQ